MFVVVDNLQTSYGFFSFRNAVFFEWFLHLNCSRKFYILQPSNYSLYKKKSDKPQIRGLELCVCVGEDCCDVSHLYKSVETLKKKQRFDCMLLCLLPYEASDLISPVENQNTHTHTYTPEGQQDVHCAQINNFIFRHIQETEK